MIASRLLLHVVEHLDFNGFYLFINSLLQEVIVKILNRISAHPQDVRFDNDDDHAHV